MTALHVYFTLRNQQAFQRLLDGSVKSFGPPTQATSKSSLGGSSRSGSYKRPSPVAIAANTVVDVNTRDQFGRTVLHLACSARDPAAVEFVRLLLTHPVINVNVPDVESHWTPLHRALYNSNLAAACVFH
jgi:inhibitor of Bruton tyrosine kinase